jgi:hypothetical protein
MGKERKNVRPSLNSSFTWIFMGLYRTNTWNSVCTLNRRTGHVPDVTRLEHADGFHQHRQRPWTCLQTLTRDFISSLNSWVSRFSYWCTFKPLRENLPQQLFDICRATFWDFAEWVAHRGVTVLSLWGLDGKCRSKRPVHRTITPTEIIVLSGITRRNYQTPFKPNLAEIFLCPNNGSSFGWGAMVQAKISRIPVQLSSLHFSICLIVPAALGFLQTLKEISARNIPEG